MKWVSSYRNDQNFMHSKKINFWLHSLLLFSLFAVELEQVSGSQKCRVDVNKSGMFRKCQTNQNKSKERKKKTQIKLVSIKKKRWPIRMICTVKQSALLSKTTGKTKAALTIEYVIMILLLSNKTLSTERSKLSKAYKVVKCQK